ncbi:hypothetical protein B0I31_12436 [Saccharothrix carnea]|uniref:Uncharacterized protein n=1 Tax=Saccharothrix carnea TaxID=1280637 RepID=A0A2P8HR06_SACCR|nr:hypothetical protein B0I31_12436 [Saccharothrix carnea]
MAWAVVAVEPDDQRRAALDRALERPEGGPVAEWLDAQP